MRRKTLSLLICSLLSLTLLAGCSKTTDNNNNSETNESNNSISENVNNNDSESNIEDSVESEDNNEDESIENIDALIDVTITTAISTLYNTDYSNSENLKNSIEFIKKHFTANGQSHAIKQIESYDGEISTSDLLITLIQEVKNNNSQYKATYNIRYNLTLIEGKPSAYSDIIATVVLDNNNNILIESLNEDNF